MKLARIIFDNFYDAVKKPVFYFTNDDPEKAHELFSGFCRFLHRTKLEEFILSEGNDFNSVKISNAAGMNKNAEIPQSVLKYLGFDRVVIGTVTAEPWKGNERPRIKRIVDGESLVTWAGLPSIGAEKIADRIISYNDDKTPITISITPTPGKTGKEMLNDLGKTISIFEKKQIKNIDRYELNPSCPSDFRDFENLNDMLKLIQDESGKEIFLKVSPDLEYSEIEKLINETYNFTDGYVTTNTMKSSDGIYVKEKISRGGASGKCLYKKSFQVQRIFYNLLENRKKIIACGGIDSREKADERKKYGAEEIQIFTPMIFRGPKLLREMKK